MRTAMTVLCALVLAAAAQAEIRVTEIWAGGLPGTESMPDWFELTNYGDTPVTPNNWYYDDDSADPTANDPVLGLGAIAPGESVLVVVSWEDDWDTAADALATMNTAWNIGGALDNLQIGWVDGGGGLGGSGDAVYVFEGNTTGAPIVATQEYALSTTEASFVINPDGTWNDDYAQVGIWGAFESTIHASDHPDVGFAIGSPGVVPEPASLMLLLASVALFARRR